MITDKELSEYHSLCYTFDSLYQKLLKRKQELRRLLEETAARKRKTLLILAKANRLTRHLTGSQIHTTGLSYRFNEIKARINQISPVLFRNNTEDKNIAVNFKKQNFTADYSNYREFKQTAFELVNLIDGIKKQLLQLDLLERRCRELLSSMEKALEAFRFEAKIIRRKIYPFGVFSSLRRSLRSFAGSPYFSYRDMGDVSALGNITGLVLKIADSSLI